MKVRTYLNMGDAKERKSSWTLVATVSAVSSTQGNVSVGPVEGVMRTHDGVWGSLEGAGSGNSRTFTRTPRVPVTPISRRRWC